MPATTVRDAVLEVLRQTGMTTVFGNPGSTELPLPGNWPNDMRYVPGLQEASVVGMADGYARASGRAAFCKLHSAAGMRHALGSPFIVENRPGAGGNIGAEAAARAELDGTTLLLGSLGPLAVNSGCSPRWAMTRTPSCR